MYEIVSICKGGGYNYCRTIPLHPNRNTKGLYPLHRVLMENEIGRSLSTNEVVHHKDKDRFNNDIENLEILSRSDHSKGHSVILEDIEIICANCGKVISLKPHLARLRIKRSKNVCCSRICSVALYHKKNKPRKRG